MALGHNTEGTLFGRLISNISGDSDVYSFCVAVKMSNTEKEPVLNNIKIMNISWAFIYEPTKYVQF